LPRRAAKSIYNQLAMQTKTNITLDVSVLTAPAYLEGEAAAINGLFDAGLQLLHVRKPQEDVQQFRTLMLNIDPAFYPNIALHQHHELADEFNITRLHFTEQKRKLKSPAQFDEFLGQGYFLSSSIHDLNSCSDLDHFGYVFYGPVFDSISKRGYRTALPSGFVVPPQRSKVYAVGGITAEKLADIKNMGFEGIGLLGTIWHQSDDPVAAFKKVIKTLNQYN